MRLPVEQRAAVVAVDMQGYSVADTARCSASPKAPSRAAALAARAKLAEMLGYFDAGAARRPRERLA